MIPFLRRFWTTFAYKFQLNATYWTIKNTNNLKHLTHKFEEREGDWQRGRIILFVQLVCFCSTNLSVIAEHLECETGDVRQETWVRRRETGDLRQEKGDRRPESWDRRRETQNVRQEIWYRRRETWDVRQEMWDRRWETGDATQEMWDRKRETGHVKTRTKQLTDAISKNLTINAFNGLNKFNDTRPLPFHPTRDLTSTSHTRHHKTRHHTLDITHSTSHTRQHTLDITHSTSQTLHHTLDITHSSQVGEGSKGVALLNPSHISRPLCYI